jgi:hypothetical protein
MENQTKYIGVICAVCKHPIELELCEFNERGQPIHSECAVQSEIQAISQASASQSPA